MLTNYPTLKNSNGVILDSIADSNHLHVINALCNCGMKLMVAPSIFKHQHTLPDNPIIICTDHGIHAYHFSDLVRGQQPNPSFAKDLI